MTHCLRILTTLALTVLLGGTASAEDNRELDERTAAALDAAISAGGRPDADRERDANRRPKDTLAFFGFRDDMTVVEMIPGGGWYTRLLAPALREHGQLYLHIGTGGLQESGLLETEPFDRVEVLPTQGPAERDGRRVALPVQDNPVDDADLVLTFRNLHNFTAEGRRNLNQTAFDLLASGGHYGVVDHTRRHMGEDTAETWRRMDPVLMIKEIEAIGFEFVDFSDLHHRPDDELRYEVGRRSVTGNTDRFTLLFRKP